MYEGKEKEDVVKDVCYYVFGKFRYVYVYEFAYIFCGFEDMETLWMLHRYCDGNKRIKRR